MRVLVTGGAGFIGSHFAKRLQAAGDDVRVLDKLTYSGNPANLEGTGIELVVGDICDAEAVAEAAAGCDAIVNFAAETHVDRSILGADRLRPDRRSSARRCCSRRCARTGARFVQVSTDEVYGDLAGGGSSAETDPISPSSPYSVAKAAGDLHIPAYARTFGVNALDHARLEHVRPEPVPGEADPADDDERARRASRCRSTATASQLRDWLCVEDHCAGIELVLREGAPGEVYNVGGDDERENVEIVAPHPRAHRRRRVARPPRRGPRRPRPPLLARHGEAARRSAGSRRSRSTEGIAETVAWYREHRDWWEPIKSGEYREYYERQYAARLAGS